MTADEIAALRGAGGTDDDVVQYLSETSPQLAGQLTEMQKHGGNSKDILDYLSETGGLKPAAPKNTSWTQGALEGASGLANGVGSLMALGGSKGGLVQDMGNALVKAGDSWHDKNYEGGYKSVKWNEPSTYGGLLRAGVEGALPMAYDGLATVGGGIAGTFVGGPGAGTAVGGGLAGGLAHYSQALAPAALERAHKNGRDTPDESDWKMAAVAILPETILNQIGLKGSGALAGKAEGLLGKGLLDTVEGGVKKTIGEGATETLKAAAREGATSAAGDATHQVLIGAGTKEGVTYDPSKTLEAAVTGATMGGAIRGGKAVKDTITAGAVAHRMGDITPEEGALATSELKDTGLDLSKPANGPKAIAAAKAKLEDQLNFGQKELSGLGYKVGEERDLNTGELNGQTFSQARKLLSKGGTLSPEHASALESLLGDSMEGQANLNKLKALQALNKLQTKGQLDVGQDGTGGITRYSPLGMLGNALRNKTTATMGTVGIGAGAAHGLGAINPALAMAGPALYVAGKGLIGAHVAMRALDNLTGARNPTQQFARRFGDAGDATVSPAAKPSLTQAQESARQQDALDAARAKLAAEGEKTTAKIDKVLNAKSKKLDSEEASQAAAVAARSEQMDRQSAAVERTKQADLEKAFPKTALAKLTQAQQQQIDARNAPALMDARRKAAQEEAMWAQQQPQAPQDAPNVDLQAQAAIKQAYAQRQAESEAAVLPGMKQRAALRKLKAQTDAAKAKEDAKTAAEAEKASNAGLPDSMAKTFKGQMRDIVNRPEPKPVKEPAPPKDEKPQGLPKSQAKALKSAMDKIRAAQAQTPTKAPEKPQETPKVETQKAAPKPEKPASEAPKAPADAPDIVHHLGVDIIVPKDVGNREAYINAAKKKQDNLYGHIAEGANLDGVSIKTGDKLQDLETKIRASRSQKDAEVLLEQVYAHATKDERHILKAHFDNKKFYALWRK